jgi:hypothetical protein
MSDMVLIDTTNDLITLRVERVDGREGAVSLRSKYNRATTAALLRKIADDYERGDG